MAELSTNANTFMKMQYECDQLENLTPNNYGQYSLCFAKDGKWTTEDVHAEFRPLPIAAMSITQGYVFVRFSTLELALEAKSRFGNKLKLMIPRDRTSGNEKNSYARDKRQRNTNREMDMQPNRNNNQADQRAFQQHQVSSPGGRGLLPVDIGIQQRELQDMTERLKGIMAMQASPLMQNKPYGDMGHDRGPVTNDTSLFRRELNELGQRLQAMMSLQQSPQMQNRSSGGAMGHDRNPVTKETSLFRKELNELEQRLQAMMSLQPSPQIQAPAFTLSDLVDQFNDYRVEMNVKMSMCEQELFSLNHKVQDVARNTVHIQRELQAAVKAQGQKDNRINTRIDILSKSLSKFKESLQKQSSNATETALTSKDLTLLQATSSMQQNHDTVENKHSDSSGKESPQAICVPDSLSCTADSASPSQKNKADGVEPVVREESPSEFDVKDSAVSLSDGQDVSDIPSTEL